MTSAAILKAARECGFELAGIAAATPSPDNDRYRQWVEQGMAGGMSYLTDRRMDLRMDPRHLLPTARSVICAGKLYNTPQPYSTAFSDAERGWISRYAWSDDYHDTLRRDLQKLVSKLPIAADYRVLVDTAPLLERSYAHRAGLGWIGKNTCLINEPLGSWFFLGEILTSLDLPPSEPPPDRCGTCTRCIDACPTQAISAQGYELDARLCISYFTIELHGPAPERHRAQIANHILGCDICQDVCPWNGRAPVTSDAAFEPRHVAPPLEQMSRLTEEEFRALFRRTPVSRAKYAGFLRNVATAMGNSRQPAFHSALERLREFPNDAVREHAVWALGQLNQIAK